MGEIENEITNFDKFMKIPLSPFQVRTFRDFTGHLVCGPFGQAGDRWSIRWSNDAHAYVWTLLDYHNRSTLETGWASTLADAVKAADNAFEKRGQFD
jgi:hypothetical protein